MQVRPQVSHNLVAKHIAAAFALMYGFVPFLVEYFDLFPAPYAQINLVFSLILALAIYAMPNKLPFRWRLAVVPRMPSYKLTFTLFIAAAVIFYLFPWHGDRESAGASLSAVFRALWLITTFTYARSKEKERFALMGLTVVLMYIDESRTYFLVSLIILAITSKYRFSLLGISISLAILLAAVRSEDSGGGADLALYGIIGEGYNATKVVGQIHESNHPINEISHLAQTFLQPVIFPAEMFISRVINKDYITQEGHMAILVGNSLDEIFNPMGGWYIVADFIHYKYVGIPLMIIYIFITWIATRAVFDAPDFPFGSFFMFIAIKSNPFIYWKFIYYIIIISLIYKLISNQRIRRARRSAPPASAHLKIN